jgi:hypothetical protein
VITISPWRLVSSDGAACASAASAGGGGTVLWANAGVLANANAAKAAQRWTITIKTGSSYTMTQTIMSNEIAVYRAVPVGAP